MRVVYVSEEWYALVEELLDEGYSIEDAEAVADEEMGYRGADNGKQ